MRPSNQAKALERRWGSRKADVRIDTEGDERVEKATDELNLKGADPVQQSLASGLDFFEENAKLLAVLVVVAILAGLGYVGFQYVQKRQERSAQDAYYAVEARFTKLKEGYDRAKLQALMPGSVPPADAKNESKPASGNLEQDYGSVLGDLEKVAREHAGTTAGAQASILLGETYLEYKQPEKAVEIAQVSAKSLGAGSLAGSLSRVLWGNALAAKGDCQAAVGVWQQVIDNKEASFLHPDVSLRSGVCYESLNQPEKAAEMYRKVTAEGGNSAAGQTAKGLLRALEMKPKNAASANQAKQG